MRKTTKTLSILMAVVMLICCMGSGISALAVYDKPNHYTQIYVEGFESKWVYYPEDPDTSLLFPIDTNRLGNAFGKIGDYLKNALAKGDPRLVYHAIYDPLFECFGDSALLPDGKTMKDCVTVDETRLRESDANKFVFKYDTRLDPVDVAKELDDYIKRVKAEGVVTKSKYPNTVTDTIELVGSSYGSAVVLAYLNEYGTENIDSVLFCVPTFGGVNFVEDLFTGNFHFDDDAIVNFLEESNILQDYAPLIDMLKVTGVLQSVIDVAVEPALKLALRDSLHDIIHDVFGTFPAFWSFVDDDHFESALAYVFNKAEDKDTYAELISKVKYYHYNVQCNAVDILQNAIDDGHKINIICKYNSALFPVSTEKDIMSDGFVAVKDATIGATCARTKNYLPETYQQAALTDYNFMSPDRMIDASTCAFPFNTWFIKGLPHGEKCDDYYDLINHIIYDDLDVFSDERWPQFLEWDHDEGVNPVQAKSNEDIKAEENSKSFINVFVRFFKMIIEKIKAIFKK